MNLFTALGLALAVGVLGFVLAVILAKRADTKKLDSASNESRRIVSEAKKEAEIIKKEAMLEAREAWMKEKSSFDQDMDRRRREQEKAEKHIDEAQSALLKKTDLITTRENDLVAKETALGSRQKGIELREKEIEKIIAHQNDMLQKIAQMSPEEAKKQLMDNMIGEAKLEAAAHIKEIRDRAERDAEKEAKEIITLALTRCAADHVLETTVAVVNLPSDEMKGRIIGREGRNIRAFETCTGVDVIVDDTPEAVILSGFDPVRREIARMALERLITDGRIHPTRIEEVVGKCQTEMDVIVREAGEQACFELGIHGMHPEIIKLVGKLKYRTSYGQNVLGHIKEVAMLCGLMAAELGLDAELAKRCGLLHDVGKAIDRETEGTHTQIGADFLRRFHEKDEVINAAEAHHNDVEILSPYPVLVQAADAISGARPGARREPLEAYIKRLQHLEELADSFKGVSKAYAIQAGREIRVIVENNIVDDLATSVLAGDIASKIEAEMQYPGQIKVTVIRESRYTEFAK
jgi:ribonuclease Y